MVTREQMEKILRGYMGSGKSRQKAGFHVRRCCGAMMQRLDKDTAQKVREQDERLKKNT